MAIKKVSVKKGVRKSKKTVVTYGNLVKSGKQKRIFPKTSSSDAVKGRKPHRVSTNWKIGFGNTKKPKPLGKKRK